MNSLANDANNALNAALATASPTSILEQAVNESKKTTEKIQTFYHIKHINFFGDTIYPLNDLERLPECAEISIKQASKYEGREWMRNAKISYFNCLFNDVIFLSPVHPNRILKALKKAGFQPIPVQFFEIPFHILAQKKCVIWKCPNPNIPTSENDLLDPDKYEEFSEKTYEKIQKIPKETKLYYNTCFAEGKKPRLFYGIPHIFVKNTISINSVKTIVWT